MASRPLWGARGNRVPWFLRGDACPHATPVPPPLGEPWWWPLSVPGRVQEETQERHQLLLAPVLRLLPGERPPLALPQGGGSELCFPLGWPEGMCPGVGSLPGPSWPCSPQASTHPRLSRQMSPHTFACAVPPARGQTHSSICLKRSFLKAQRDANFVLEVLFDHLGPC